MAYLRVDCCIVSQYRFDWWLSMGCRGEFCVCVYVIMGLGVV